ncbi:MAG: TIGR01212 family radical SAM protein [Candidatus Omnitrophica bacterium]|nr:TIGR01212 family radical SAM protein [Candidatus Omnitrophota bacterium]
MKLYNDYNSYLKEKYGCKVYKIGLDAGFTCPNRDGQKGSGGCIYCNAGGSRAPYVNQGDPLKKQLEYRIGYLKEKRRAKKFIAYFQAFTNTYAPLERLKNTYDEVLPFKDIVGISIGTRPDAIDRDKLRLIASYKNRYEVWVEYGLQSIHDKTLRYINRGHDFNAFLNAVHITKEFALPMCAHVILGLPGETRDDMMATAKKMAELKINGIKIHLLHILKGSKLEPLYAKGQVQLLGEDEYVELACDFLEYLPPDMVIQRLTGEGGEDDHIAPTWALDKIGTINKIRETLTRRGSYQSFRIASTKESIS